MAKVYFTDHYTQSETRALLANNYASKQDLANDVTNINNSISSINTSLNSKVSTITLDTVKKDLEDKITAVQNTPSGSDVNLSNISASGKTAITGYVAPSTRYINLSWSNGASYTAPANGWFTAWGTFTEGGLGMYNTANGLGNSSLNNSGARNTGYCSIPVKTGQTIKVYNTYGGASMQGFRFVYAEGN